MAILKTPTPRRREVRKHVPRTASTWVLYLGRREVAWAVAWALAFTLGVSLITYSAGRLPKYYEGQIISRAIVPRVQFKAIDDEATKKRGEYLQEIEPAVYRPNRDYLQNVRNGLGTLLHLAHAGAGLQSIDEMPTDTTEAPQLTAPGFAELKRFNQDDKGRAKWKEKTNAFINNLAGMALLAGGRVRAEKADTDRAEGIKILHPELGELERPDEVIYSIDSIDSELRLEALARKVAENLFPAALRDSIVAIVMKKPEPLYLWDKDQTKARRQQQYDSPDAIVEVTYRTDDVLVPAQRRHGEPGLTKREIFLIEREEEEYLAQMSPIAFWLMVAGRVGTIALMAAALWVYILAYNQKLARNPTRGLGMTALLVLSLGLAAVTSGYMPMRGAAFAAATFPTLLAAIVLAIVYDQRFALAIGVLHTLLVMLCLDLSLGFTIILLAGVGVAVAQLDEVRTRSKLVQVGFWAGLAMAAATVLVGLATRDLTLDNEFWQVLKDALFALSAGVVTGIVVQGILPGIERAFKVTTSMTLKDLNDASLPLLRRLAQEAPGTYQHSLRLADLAEEAAQTIGANGLMCKVGAMYHDIGKINKPAYFVENQAGGPNRHRKLSPAMSLLIIVGHVKDGIELAREYALPHVLRHFIESHHGTTLVEFFYHAAKQQRDAENKPAPQDFEYRYPGPKPRTREAAILLLCDGVESAARTLEDPTPARLEQLVHNMARKRLMDGQFDECNLTLQELYRIEQAVTQTLCATYHARVHYPQDQEDQPKPDESLAAPAAS